jgi:hypothetical protein
MQLLEVQKRKEYSSPNAVNLIKDRIELIRAKEVFFKIEEKERKRSFRKLV